MSIRIHRTEFPKVRLTLPAPVGPFRRPRPRARAQLVVVVLALAALAAACSSNASTSGSSTSTTAATLSRPAPVHATITVAAVGSIDGTSFFSARQQGFFNQWGLDANVQVYPTGVEVMNQVASGAAQFGDVGAAPILTTISKGLPLTIIADNHGSAVNSYYAQNQAIVAGPNTGIRAGDIASLKGKKIGVAVNTDAVGYLQTLLATVHLSLSDISQVNLAPADGVTALARGSVDAIATFEPWPSVALQEIPGSVLVEEDNSKTWYDPGVIISSTSYLAANPHTAVAFLAAISQSESWVRSHLPQAATNATQSITGLLPAVANRAIEHVTFDPRLSKLVFQGLQSSMVGFLKNTNQLTGPVSATSAINPTFMLTVQKYDPQFFSDLPPIPAAAVMTSG